MKDKSLLQVYFESYYNYRVFIDGYRKNLEEGIEKYPTLILEDDREYTWEIIGN